MAQEIIDGTGKGFRAQVDADHRLHVNSVSRTQDEQAALLGVAYNLSTGSITLTSDNKSCIAYMKYTGVDPFVIKEILMIPSDSTGGSGNASIEILRNPTAGTIISNAVDFTSINNRDFSSSNSIDNESDIYKGAEGDTLTDGSSFAFTTRDNFNLPITFDAANIVLRKGNSIGVCITPPTSNTAQTWVCAIIGFVETATVSGDLK
jgi:hypothetical protein